MAVNHDIGQERVGSDQDVGAGDEHPREQARPPKKKSSRAFRSLGVRTVKRGNGERLAPSKAGEFADTPPFPFLSFACFWRVLEEAVGRSSDHRMDRVLFPPLKPVEAVILNQSARPIVK